ncbi:MAG: hypothetical protein Kilf2KO_37580 [Rhodospirillales bacterium]
MKLKPLEVGDLWRLDPCWAGLPADRRDGLEAALTSGSWGILAQAEGVDLGYALYAARAPYRPATFAADPKAAEIVALGVRPDRRARGVGKSLLHAVGEASAASGIGTLVATVAPDDTDGLRFFSSQSFLPAWTLLARLGSSPSNPQGPEGLTVKAVLPAEVEDLRSLWLTLHRHHQSVAPELGPFVDEARSWDLIGALFRKAAESDLLLRMDEAGRAVALIWVAKTDVVLPLLADRPAAGGLAEIKVLIVADRLRGKGIGTGLLNEAANRLRALGVTDLMVGAIHPNRHAIRLYRREGFRPVGLELFRRAP